MADLIVTASDPNPRRGGYEIGGVRYPRVTTIIGIVSQPGLEAWRAKVGLQEAARISRESADLGTAIHAACEEIDRGALLDAVLGAGLEIEPYVRAYLGWYQQHVRRVLSVEEVVHHPRHQYAGQLDLFAELRDGRRMIVDRKSGKTVSGLVRLQTTAYAEAKREMGDQVDGRMVVHLPSDRPGTVNIIELDDDERDLRAWRSCLRLWRWWQRHASDWKGTAK